jgi:DNA-binding transcriptional LysR family regulator
MVRGGPRIDQNVTSPVHLSAQGQLAHASVRKASSLRVRAATVAPATAKPVPSLDRLSWDNLRLLLVLAETGSFRSAAIAAGISLNTIRSKIDRLERQFGTALLRRSVEGARLTQEGHELVAIARQMAALGNSASRVQRAGAERPHSTVKITVTEGLGTFWLVPRLVEFRAAHPGVKVEINCDMTTPDVLFRDVDIAVQLTKPTSPDLIVKRIGTMHLMPFAADSYLREYGTPASVADAANHQLVWQQADQVATDALPLFVDSGLAESMIAVQTNTSSAHYWAVAKGAGIGFLPTYARALSRSTRPLDIGVQLRRDIYVVHHPDAVRFPEVREALDWLTASFDKTKFPWFADEFIHPDEFEQRFTDSVVVNLFEGFISPQ